METGNIDNESEQTGVCYKCNGPGEYQCRMENCKNSFCAEHGNVEEQRCGKCDQDYNF